MLVDVVNHRLCGKAVNLASGNALGLGFGRGTLSLARHKYCD